MHAIRCCLVLLGAEVILLVLSASPQAQEPPGWKPGRNSDLDKMLYRGLAGAINQGVDLYRAGDHYGCYRLFQGILIGIRPLLADQPELQRLVDKGLTDAEKRSKSQERAWALRETLDQLRGKLRDSYAREQQPAARVPELKEPNVVVPPVKIPKLEVPPVKTPRVEVPPVKVPKVEVPPVKSPAGAASEKSDTSLWVRLGGSKNVPKIVDDFTTLAAADPKVDFTRGGRFKLNKEKTAQFKQQMVDFLSSVTGGPFPYFGKSMKEAHKGMKITDEEFDAAAADLRKAMEANGVKKDDIDSVLRLVEKKRKDIVEVPDGDGDGTGRTPGRKKQDKSSFEPFRLPCAKPQAADDLLAYRKVIPFWRDTSLSGGT
jgi:hemoglobin